MTYIPHQVNRNEVKPSVTGTGVMATLLCPWTLAFTVGPSTTALFLRKFFKGHFSVVGQGTQIKLTGARFLQEGFVDTQMGGRLAYSSHHQDYCGAFLAGLLGDMQPVPFKSPILMKVQITQRECYSPS